MIVAFVVHECQHGNNSVKKIVKKWKCEQNYNGHYFPIHYTFPSGTNQSLPHTQTSFHNLQNKKKSK